MKSKSLLKSLLASTIFIASALLMSIPIYAQDSAVVASGSGSGLPSWVPLVGTIVLGIYELLVRYLPTVKNYSIVGLVIKIIQAVVPNNNANTPSQPHP